MKAGLSSRVRRSTAVLAAKVVGHGSRSLGRGGGTSLPGIVAERLAPDILADLGGQLRRGVVLVTGTNGKTTTARMISEVLLAHGYRVVRNRAGANMPRGLVTSLVDASAVDGTIPDADNAIGVFEVDEAFLPAAVEQLRPARVVLLNVFRDQLDRYGEVANIPSIWRQPLASLPSGSRIVANGDDPLVTETVCDLSNVCWYGLDLSASGPVEHGGDVKTCPRCGGVISYSVRYYGHLGKYASPCGFERPRLDVIGRDVTLHAMDGSTARLKHGEECISVSLPLTGLYNVTNAVAAAATALSLGVPLATSAHALERLTSAFGRMESFSAQGRTIYLLLGKNPTGYNQVLRTVFDGAEPKSRNVLFILNDNPADGRDVSWIWDVDFERIGGRMRYAACAGARADDMALRLKYAGVGELDLLAHTLADTARAFDSTLGATPPGSEMYIFATYTAMLDVRTLLTRRGFAPPYWER